MKVCPICQKAYSDDNLNFCLEDGTVLTQATGQDVPPPTVMMSSPPPTVPRTTFGNPPTTQSSWNAPVQYAPPPRKSSKTWIWVLGILAVLVLVCGGGGIALVALVAYLPTDNSNSNSGNNRVAVNNKNTPPFNAVTNSVTKTTTDGRSGTTVDLSALVHGSTEYGNTEFTNGEYLMSSKQKRYYYAVLAQDVSTSNATTRVTVRNVDNADSSLGYGLIFHSAPKALVQDYAFLIDTKKKKYRVVRHGPSTETAIVDWTSSNLIKDGTQENILECRDKGDSTDLYLNDQLVTSVKNTWAYKGGQPGLYSGDGVTIGFKDLKIIK